MSDLGFFHGRRLTEYFNVAMMNRAEILGFQPKNNLTFEEHLDIFRVKLGVMGSNLQNMQSVLFSADTTPKFPVATAIRISMSVPMIFKPIVIRSNDRDLLKVASYASYEPPKLSADDLEGVWVDGGLFNNIPLRVLDTDMQERGLKTLGLRLGRRDRNEINNIVGNQQKRDSVRPERSGA